MQSTDPNVLAALRELAQDNPRVDVLWLYGSRAKGTAGPESDYDLAVAFNAFPEDPWERRLQPELLAMEWADALGLDIVGMEMPTYANADHPPPPMPVTSSACQSPRLRADAAVNPNH
jgi:hypothetical protein